MIRVEQLQKDVLDHEGRLRFLERWVAAIGGGVGLIAAAAALARQVGLFAIVAAMAITVNAQTERQACTFTYKLKQNEATRAFDNRRPGCAYWTLTYSGYDSVTVETSANGTTWTTTGMTATSGVIPTAPAVSDPVFGKVSLTGYAPYIRVRATSGVSPFGVEGTLYGSVGLSAAGIPSGAALPSWIAQNSYTPVANGSFTLISNNPLATATYHPSGAYLINNPNGNAGGSTNISQICRTYTGNHTFTFRGSPYTLQDDGGQQKVGVMLRNSTNGQWIWHEIAGTTTGNRVGFTRCSAGCTVTTGAGLAILAGYWPTVSGWGYLMPLTVRLTADATNYYFRFVEWGEDIYSITNSAWAVAKSQVAGIDQVCLAWQSGNGNYGARIRLIGYSED